MHASEIGADTAGDAYLPQSGNGGYRTVSIALSLRYRIARNESEIDTVRYPPLPLCGR